MKTKKEITQRQQELINLAKTQNRDLSVEEQAEFDGLQRDLEKIEADEAAAEDAQRSAAPSGNSPEQVAQRAVEAERQRTAEITSLCREFNIEPDAYLANGSTIDQARAAVLEELKRNNRPVGVRVAADEGDKYRDSASDGLMLRSGLPVGNPAAGAGDMRGMSLRDLAIDCLAREGEDTNRLLRMDQTDLYNNLCRQFYNPTAAFPAILDATIRKSIIHLYEHVPTTFQAWTTTGSLKDFKETSDYEYVIGGAGDFLLVPENGELKHDVPKTEKMPSRKIDTYGRQFSMTRQAFINDDIGFLTEVPGLYATKAKQTIDKMVYRLLYDNNKIFDGVPLFDDKHSNIITTGSKPSQASLQAMIKKMQLQKDQFGEAIYVTPQHIIVPVGYEFDLAVILHSTQITGSNNNDINPLYNYPLDIIQTPVLNALAGDKAAPWFMVANQMSAKSIQVDYLNGQDKPTVRRMEAPGVLGFTWDMFLDWGIAVRDYRGIAKNKGEVIA